MYWWARVLWGAQIGLIAGKALAWPFVPFWLVLTPISILVMATVIYFVVALIEWRMWH